MNPSLVKVVAMVALGACGATQPQSPKSGSLLDNAQPRRHKVLLEIDRMKGRPALVEPDRITSIFAAAGIDVEVREDQADLPEAPSVTLGDIHSLMTTNHHIAAPEGTWKLHLLILSEEEGHPRTLGIMFDFGAQDVNDVPREGCAIFADAHKGATKNAEMMLTAVHELAHCFNIHHTDWEGGDFYSGSTIESYSMTDTCQWRLSSKSIEHLKDPTERFFAPGKGGVPFGYISKVHATRHQPSPQEEYLIVDAARVASERFDPQAATAARSEARELLPTEWSLRLRAPKTTYALGEPVYLDCELANDSDHARKLLLALDPREGLLQVSVRKEGSDPKRLLSPVHACARRRPDEMPARSTARETFQVFFGADGWTMKESGTYAIDASFAICGPGESETTLVRAQPLTLTVTAPTASPAAKEVLTAHRTGVYLMLEGASHLEQTEMQLAKLFDEKDAFTPDQRAAIGLALAKASFRPSLGTDPSRRVAKPDLEKARKYLAPALRENVNVEQAVRVQKAFTKSLRDGDPQAPVDRQNLRQLQERRLK
jgi:hypothetical protein